MSDTLGELSDAIKNPDEAAVVLLLAAGTGASERQHGGRTALRRAALRGTEEMARWLLTSGADPRLTSADGKRPIDLLPGGDQALHALLA